MNDAALIETIFVVFSGLVFGSFITLASYRLPLGEGIIRGPSRCPSCRTSLGFKDLWPVLSWLAHKGCCRHCRARISVRYPLIELVTAGIFLLLYARYGLSPAGIMLAFFSVILLIMIVADFEHYIIPDEVHLALLPLGVIYHWLASSPLDAVAVSCAFGAALGLMLHHGYRFLRKKEGLGFGDVKFLAVAGLWLGNIMLFPPFLLFSGLLGIMTGLAWRALGLGERFPFGPALAAALFLCVAYPEFPALFWAMGQTLAFGLSSLRF